MTDETERCGYDLDGQPCQLPASRDDGRCHHHTGIEEERARGGRPSQLEDVYDDVMDAAERGLTYEGIARVAGIGLSTLNDWRDKHDEFAQELEQKRAVGEMRLVDRVVEEKPEFILERSYDYIKTEKREIDADVDQNIDTAEGVTAEFVTYSPESDGDE